MAQIVKPITTESNGDGWYNNDETTTLHTYVDEFIATADDDTTFIKVNNGFFEPITFECQLKFDTLTDPSIHTGHIIRVRSKRTILSDQTITVNFYQGNSTLIKSSNITATSSYANSTITLSEAEAANITDYTDVRIGLSYDHDGVTSSPRVTTVEFEVPDASGGGGGAVVSTVTPTAFFIFL